MNKTLINQKYRDYSAYLNNYDEIIEYAIKNNYDVFTVPGALLDHTLIYAGKGFTLGSLKPRNYIIFTPEYVNCWSSAMKVTLTDKDEAYDDFMTMHDEYYESELI